jgi:hypothetical protein
MKPWTTPTPASDEPEIEAPAGFDVFAKFGLTIDSLASEIQQDRRSRQQSLARQPIYRVVPGQAVTAGGIGKANLGSPTDGREWIVKLLGAVNFTYKFSTQSGASAQGTGAAGVTVIAPASMFTITGFSVSAGAATAAGTVTVTLTNVLGGPYVYYMAESVAGGGSLSQSLSLPASGTPTLTVSGDATGGPVSANLYGTENDDPSVMTWYIGTDIPLDANGNQPNTEARWFMPQLPHFEKFSTDVLRVKHNENLIAVVQNNFVAPYTDIIAVVLDQPIGHTRIVAS